MTIASPASMSTVVIANGLNGYGAVRSLARAGIKSIVIVPSVRDLSALSRLPSRCYVLPLGANWEKRLLEFLAGLQLTSRAPLLACSDRAAAFLQSYRNQLRDRYALLIPEENIIQILNDKLLELDAIRGRDVIAPESIGDLTGVNTEYCPIAPARDREAAH